MEPQPFGHGNHAMRNLLILNMIAFNGATAFRPWKRPRRRRWPWSWRPFNGATAFRPWKPRCPFVQLGPVAEPFNGATAFRPWKLALAPLIMDLFLTFNGATAFRPWKPVVGYLKGFISGGNVPSMEPQPFGHGNKSCYGYAHQRPGKPTLQWSHSLSAMETSETSPSMLSSGAHPSMEPQPFGHGNVDRRRPVTVRCS